MITMHPVQTVPSLCVLTLSVLLALRFGRVKADGELVSITLKCGDIKNLTSPNYPGNYNNNLKIHWDVRADLAQRIVVTFNDFHTDDFDFLYVEEEDFPSYTAKYSGSKAATPYISLGNHLAINFTSDLSESRRGFHLSISCFKETATFRLQDCRISTSRCIAQNSLVIVCSVLSELGCFNLAEYTNLLSRSVKLSRYQCLTHCKALSTTPQYAVHHSGTNCSCVNQTALDVTELSQERSRCRTKSESQTGHYATLFNVSFGFCSEPPELDNGSWSNTLNGFMYGTTITAKCNDNYELVGEDRKMRCDKVTTSTTQDFEWHGIMPSCQQRGPADDESLSGSVFPSTTLLPNVPVNGTCKSVNYCAIPFYALVPVVILFILALISVLVLIVVEFVLWMIRRSKPIDLGSSAVQSQLHA